MDAAEEPLKVNISHILQNLNFDEQNKTTTQTEQFICKWLDRLQQVLIDLKYTIEKYNNVDRILTDFPDVCQFLGRLNQISILALHPKLLTHITECILKLYKERPTTPLEKKTQEWVLFQIRNSLCLPREQEVLFEHVGRTSDFTYQKALSMLEQQVIELKNKTTNIDGYLIPCEIKTPKNEDDICRILNFLLYNRDQHFSSLVDAFMDFLSVNSSSEPVRNLFKNITNLQKDIYTEDNFVSSDVTLVMNTVCLSTKSLVRLWTSYLPSLEYEVLSLVTQAVKMRYRYSIPKIKSLLDYRHLPQSCAANYQLFYLTVDILHSLAQPDVNPRVGGRQAVLVVISLFYDSVHDYLIKNTKNEESFLLASLYPTYLSDFVKNIQTISLTHGVSSPACAKNLSSCVRAFYEETCDGRQPMAKIWLYTQHFSSKLSSYLYRQICLLPDNDVSDCLFLLLWLYEPLSLNNEEIFTLLVYSLSRLKTLFKTSDCKPLEIQLEELLSDFVRSKNATVLKTLFHCLLLTCLISADSYCELTDRMLELISGCKELKLQVTFFLSAQTFLPLHEHKIRDNYLRVISLCKQKLQLEISLSNIDTNDELSEYFQACIDVIDVYSK